MMIRSDILLRKQIEQLSSHVDVFKRSNWATGKRERESRGVDQDRRGEEKGKGKRKRKKEKEKGKEMKNDRY